jgi:predicted metal-dependent peptidase
MAAMTPERKLKKVTISLMRSPLFADMAGILMLGSKTIDDRIPTACTNGRDELYGRAFVERLNDKQLGFVVIHEACHKMYRHMSIWQKLFEQDPQLTNMAADYVVNLAIVDRDPQSTVVSMPVGPDGKPMCLYDRRFRGMNTKQVFDILKQEQKSGGKGQSGDGESDGKGGGSGGDLGDGETLDHHDWPGAEELTKEEKQELEKQLDQAIRQGQIAAKKLAGAGGGNMDRELGDLLNPKVDWREILREFVTSLCNGRDYSSWRRPSRRFLSGGIVMPSMVGESVGPILVGIDTSGSIGGPELNRFLTEVKEIVDTVRPEKIDLVYWDGHVAGHEVYDHSNMDTLVTSTKPKGGGGTDPTCVVKYMAKHNMKPECVIMLTDGCIGNWGDWDVPLLWCICGNWGRNTYAPVGKTVHIED